MIEILRHKSGQSQGIPLLQANEQKKLLTEVSSALNIDFQHQLNENNLLPLKPTSIDTLQINMGKMCNQVCTHCHVDAGPDRKEIMEKATMIEILKALEKNPSLKIVDLTGGAPEMNPHFRWFVEQLFVLNVAIQVRCNLTIIVSNKQYNDLPSFFATNKVEVISSLPYFEESRTNKQRGNGVFGQSIEALKRLNLSGYGLPNTNLVLNLVYNPAGAFLPGNQIELEAMYKKRLFDYYGIVFNNLFCITNMPISRFLIYLKNSGNLPKYMQRLNEKFNVNAAKMVMCRNLISVAWDGKLFDCDFNQMLEMPITEVPNIADLDIGVLKNRAIKTGEHCWGCTAGDGSSCGGNLT